MSVRTRSRVAKFLSLFALSISVQAATVTFVSGGDPTGNQQWNSVNGQGTPNVVLTPNPNWFNSLGTARWVSYANTGDTGVSPPDSGTFGNLGANPTASFFITFVLPNPTNLGSITVYADDTAAVYLADPGSPPQQLHGPNTGPEDAHCVTGPIGCGPGEGAVVNLDGLSAGSHTIRIDAWQLGGGPFGVLYSGSIESTGTPEPATAGLLGAGLVGLAIWSRRKRTRRQ